MGKIQNVVRGLRRLYALVASGENVVARLARLEEKLDAIEGKDSASLRLSKDTLEQVLSGLSQLEDIVSLELHSPPPPPEKLQRRVVGCYSPDFIGSGWSGVDNLNELLGRVDKNISGFSTVLDFGCGCGRIIRGLSNRYPGIDLHGSDIDGEAIEWLTGNYGQFGTFYANPVLPKTHYKEDQFDFIYSISIFTHLPEEMQFQWLEELSRITVKGGALILTTHGEKSWKLLGEDVAETVRERGFYYHKTITTEGLPDFYMNSYHSHDYIRSEWSKYFEVQEIVTLGMQGLQDAVILKNR